MHFKGCRMVNARLCETARLISFLRARDLFSLAKEIETASKKNSRRRDPWNLAKILRDIFWRTIHSHSLTHPHRAHEDSWGRPENCATHPGPPPMQQQPPTNTNPAGFFLSPRFFSTFLLAGLASFYLQVPTLVQSSRCWLDLSAARALSISIFSLVWGLIPVYSLLLHIALRCSDG